MFKITMLNQISDTGLDHLSKEKFDLSKDEKNPEGIILRSFKMNEELLNPELLAIARAGAGVNNIPVDICAEKGIVVFNTPGANANAVKELVVAGLLLSTRKIVDGINWTQNLKGMKEIEKEVESGKAQFTGPELHGKKICVVGLGAIGVMVANISKSLGMEVLGYDPFMSVDAAWGLFRSVNKAIDLNAILPECDFVTLHMPLTEKTTGMFNADIFKVMKKGARLLNFSRAELVDSDSLNDALSNETLSCYVTDFPTEKVIQMPNVIAIPHLGASTPESEENCAEMAAVQLRGYLETGTIVNSVNFPNCKLPGCFNKRIMVLHKNIPNMIGQITSAISKYGLNIEHMVNKSKGSYAYTVVDVDELRDEENVTKDIKAINSVSIVRVL